MACAASGAGSFTIDLDSTICETYGLAKEGARQHGYTGVRGYHPLIAVAAGTGEVLMARQARTAPTPLAGPRTSCVRRWRVAAPPGRQLTMRAESGFYNHAVVAVSRKQDVRFSITIRQQPNVRAAHRGDAGRGLDADSSDADPVLAAGRRGCRRATCTPFQHK